MWPSRCVPYSCIKRLIFCVLKATFFDPHGSASGKIHVKYLNGRVHCFLWILRSESTNCYIITSYVKILIKSIIKKVVLCSVATRWSEVGNMKLSVVIPQRCRNFVIRLQVSVLVVERVAANCIETLFVDLPNAFDLFSYSLPFN